jgi:RNA polymerase sigma-70 factor (ECF subfamily)
METNQGSELADSELVRKVQAGDSEAFERLVRRYYRQVFSLASAYLSVAADAEDVVQDSFLRVLDRIQTFNPRRPFTPWLYQVARNVAKNFRRKLGRHRVIPLSDVEGIVESSFPEPAEEAGRSELRRHVAMAISQLPRRQRLAFTLFELEGYNANEVGEMMGLNAAAVRSNVYHARRTLHARLAIQLQKGERA